MAVDIDLKDLMSEEELLDRVNKMNALGPRFTGNSAHNALIEQIKNGIEELGLPVVVTSGFRTKRLNSLLAHASDRSQHMLGQAADFYVGPSTGSGTESRRELLIKAFRLIIESERIDYDQLIIYPTFIHVSFVSKERNRRNILKARSDGKLGYGKLTRANALKLV